MRYWQIKQQAHSNNSPRTRKAPVSSKANKAEKPDMVRQNPCIATNILLQGLTAALGEQSKYEPSAFTEFI